MGKFPFKRPRIISKKFPEMDSTIDGVTKSLNDLVFSYSETVEKALQKKHIMMAFSSMVLLIVLGSFISPKGKADISTFYPDTCLGGWINPHLAEGELNTTSNGDATQFTKSNSSILPKNTDAEMYCGNFKGKFDSTTKPTKILVSLALTKGEEALLEGTATTTLLVASTTEVLGEASSTVLLQASSTDVGTSTSVLASSTELSSGSSTEVATTTASTSTLGTAVALPTQPEQGESLFGGIVKSLQDTVTNLFNTTEGDTTHTDTVVIPPPPQDTPPDTSGTPPTSYLQMLQDTVISYLFPTVFAQESVGGESTSSEILVQGSTTLISEGTTTNLMVDNQTIASSTEVATTTVSTSTLLENGSSAPDLLASTTETTGTDNQPDNQFQNNFLEVFYSFDGVTWTSLGKLNEISMKYRTFEIPVTASTSWSNLGQLQIKIIAKKNQEETPSIYLDGMKVEVLYETTLAHVHPDFARDTIVNDETINGVRVVTIINNDTNQEEIWYMYLEEGESMATSTLLSASSTEDIALATTTSATSSESVTSSSTDTLLIDTASTSTSTSIIKPVVPKNVWLKFDGKKEEGVSAQSFVNLLRKIDEEKLKDELERKQELPDFALDIIRRIKGTFLNTIIVQLEKDSVEELWLYDVEKGAQEKIDVGTSTIAASSPLGVKGGYVFWLSEDMKYVFAYNLVTKVIAGKEVPPYNASLGERAEIMFDDIPWTVIIGGGGFTFFSKETGEVFSDDDGSVTEAFREKVKLDTMLTKDQLSNLNLQVETEIENH